MIIRERYNSEKKTYKRVRASFARNANLTNEKKMRLRSEEYSLLRLTSAT